MIEREFRLRLFGALYIPAQFLTVWLLYFGPTVEPSILQLTRAFGVADIVFAVLEFAALIPIKAFTAQKLIVFLVLMVPYLLRLILSLWRVLLFVGVALQLCLWVVALCFWLSHVRKVKCESATVINKIGGPGSGKSSSAGYDVQIKARAMWGELRWRYWLYKGMYKRWIRSGNMDKLQRWHEVRDAYEFYVSHPDAIPCLWSNIPVEDLKGRKANELNISHLYQRARLPAFSVLYIDEIGSMVDVDLYKDKPFDLSNLFRFCRHFGNFVIYATEQSAENIYIDARRVVAYNEYMLGQKWTCKPYAAIAVYNLLKAILIHIPKASELCAPAMCVFNDAIRRVGFRRYISCYEGNTERTASMYDTHKHKYYLPSALNYNYDDRTYSGYYLAKDMPLDARIYRSLTLDIETEAGRRYLRMLEAQAAEQQAREDEAREFADNVIDNLSVTDISAAIKLCDLRRKLIDRLPEDEVLRADLVDRLHRPK